MQRYLSKIPLRLSAILKSNLLMLLNQHGLHLKEYLCGGLLRTKTCCQKQFFKSYKLEALQAPRGIPVRGPLCSRRAQAALLSTAVCSITRWFFPKSPAKTVLLCYQAMIHFFQKVSQQWYHFSWATTQVNDLPRLVRATAYPLFLALVGLLMFLVWTESFLPWPYKSSQYGHGCFTAQLAQLRGTSPLSWFN